MKKIQRSRAISIEPQVSIYIYICLRGEGKKHIRKWIKKMFDEKKEG